MKSLTLGSREDQMPDIQPYWMKMKEPREFKISKREPNRHRMADLVASLTGVNFKSGEKSENLVDRKVAVFRSNKRSSSFVHMNMLKSNSKSNLVKRKGLPGMIRSFNQSENVVRKHRAKQVRILSTERKKN